MPTLENLRRRFSLEIIRRIISILSLWCEDLEVLAELCSRMGQTRDIGWRKPLRAGARDPMVLGLPRGGVPLAAIVADRLSAPLDLLLMRKIGMPGNPELAAGAVEDGPKRVISFSQKIIAPAGLTEADFTTQIESLQRVIEMQRSLYLDDRLMPSIQGRTVIVVDDGIATGATVRAAILALRQHDPAEVWIAVPIAPVEALHCLESKADRVICLETPRLFRAVGAHYRLFGQVSDERVVDLMRAGLCE